MTLIYRGVSWIAVEWFKAFALSLKIAFLVASFGLGWFVSDLIFGK